MKRKRRDFENTGEVLIGSEEAKFIIHVDIFRARSLFLRLAFSEQWNEQRRPVDLKDVEVKTFNDYLEYVYESDPPNLDGEDLSFAELTELHVLADKLGDCKTANTVIDAIVQQSYELFVVPDAEVVNYVMEHSLSGSPLRRLMVDIYVLASKSVWENAQTDEGTKLLQSFLIETLLELTSRKEEHSDDTVRNAFTWGNRCPCHYHQHDNLCPSCVGEAEGSENDESVSGSEDT